MSLVSVIQDFFSGGSGNSSSSVEQSAPGTNLFVNAPNYGYADFLNDLTNWKKQLSSVYGDPGWFYFKVFFHFDTEWGLFGGTLGRGNDSNIIKTNQTNCALGYLQKWDPYYTGCKLKERANALMQFSQILSFINRKSPWFWQSITGLDKAGSVDLNEPWKKRQIEIECLEDAVDMRLTTMMDLYKYACFDYINFKEIIPENLRKFDMSIVVFASPITYLHDRVKTASGIYTYKSMTGIDENRMSFKLFTFKNCEFMTESLGNYIPGDVSNTQPFQLGKNKMIIQYDKCIQHTSNEFNSIVFGDTGFYKERMANNSKRNNAIAQAYDNTSFNPAADQYKALINESEEKITDVMRTVNNSAVIGNTGDSSLGGTISNFIKGLFG